MSATHMNITSRWRRGVLALGVGSLLVGGLAACDSAGPESGVDVEDLSEGDVTDDESGMDGDVGMGDGYDGFYDTDYANEDYVGQTVVLSAGVNEVLNDQAFTIGDEVGLEPLLVLYQEGVELEEGENVRVTGVVQEEFVLTDVEDDWGVDFDDAAWSEWEGVTYVDATMIDTDVEFEDE